MEHLQNEHQQIFVKLDGIQILLIFDSENPYLSIKILWNFNFFRLEHLKNASSQILVTLDGIYISSIVEYENESDPMILIFGGIETLSMSGLTNKRASNSSLFRSLFPSKYLHHPSFNSIKLFGKYISSIFDFEF